MTRKGNSALSNGREPAHGEVENDVAADDVPETTEAPAEDTATAADADANADEPTSAPQEADAEAEVVSKHSWARLASRTVAVLLVAAALGGIGYGGWVLYQQHQRDVASRDALHAAETYAAVLTSIDTGAIDQNFTDVLNGSTGDFKDMYSKSSAQLRQLLLDNKASAHGTVLESAVQSVTPDNVVVLLFVDQSITNSAVPDPRIDRSRIKMTMHKIDGHWLASKVELP